MELDIKPFKNLQLLDLPNEEWVDVYGYDGIYEVSNKGRVKSLARHVQCGKRLIFVKERILKQQWAGKLRNRVAVSLSCNGIMERREVNVISFYSFYPEKLSSNEGKEICHLNKDATDNRLENLELKTRSNSKKIGAKHGVCDKLVLHNKNRGIEYKAKTHRTCKNCKETKGVDLFEYGRNLCRSCKSKISYDRKLLSQNKSRVNKPKNNH